MSELGIYETFLIIMLAVIYYTVLMALGVGLVLTVYNSRDKEEKV